MTDLYLALKAVEDQLGLSGLNRYALEDNLPGYYEPDGNQYSIPYAADGKFLYALIRALKSARVLEIGTAYGGSARHILEALEANGQGALWCIDINPDSRLDGIPEKIKHRVRLYHDDATLLLEHWANEIFPFSIEGNFRYDFIHEDGPHSIHSVHAIYNLLPKILKPDGVIVSHDIGTGVRDDILQGIKNAGFETPPLYIYDGSPCGFSVMRYEP